MRDGFGLTTEIDADESLGDGIRIRSGPGREFNCISRIQDCVIRVGCPVEIQYRGAPVYEHVVRDDDRRNLNRDALARLKEIGVWTDNCIIGDSATRENGDAKHKEDSAGAASAVYAICFDSGGDVSIDKNSNIVEIADAATLNCH